MSNASGPVHEPTGVALGPESPLLTRSGVLRRLQASEADLQVALLEVLVGPAKKGERRTPGAGMTGRFPELGLIYAINPNKGGQRQVAARGIAKAMGQLQDMPDLHLPVARGGYAGMYIEMKRPGSYGTKAQRELHDRLRDQAHLVVEFRDVQEAVDSIVRYLRMSRCFASAGSGA